jgi:transcriptional regulator with XRE-family HTH domain
MATSERNLSAPDAVRKIREKTGWTQRELAQRVGVTDRAISTYQDGSRQPSPNRLQRLLALATDPHADPVAQPETSLDVLRREMNDRFFSLEKQIAELRGMLLQIGARKK